MKNLFQIEDADSVRYLNVIYNDSLADNFNLFDSERFDEISIVTYVSSFSFLFDSLKGFKKAKVVIGDEENSINFSKLSPLSAQLDEDFLNDLRKLPSKESIVKKILSNDFVLKFALNAKPIHSKIYILKSDESRLVAVGSANFSKTAFANNKQFEELIVYDSYYNPKFCQIYEERFEKIFNYSVDFVNKRLKEKISEVLVSSDNISLTIGKSEKADIVADKISIVNAKSIDIGINSHENFAHIEDFKKEMQNAVKELEKISNIKDLITKKTQGKIETVKITPTIKEKITQVITNLPSSNDDILQKRQNQSLVYDYASESIMEPYKEGDKTLLKKFALTLDIEELKNELVKLNSFINMYYKFTNEQSEDYLKYVFEAILYAFSSVFIHRMRKDIKDKKGEEKISELPIIFIMGGLANTGKTYLLNAISKLMGSYEVFSYEKLYTRNQDTIKSIFETENVFPIFVDEIANNFFKGRGEEIIKEFTNTLYNPHPCLIGTTNKTFTAESQVVRRIYYIHFANTINTRIPKQEIDEYTQEKIGALDDKLFRHFVGCFSKFISENEDFYTNEDVLYVARKIFKQLYAECKLPVPNFISDKPIDSYYRIGMIDWKNLYNTDRQRFIEVVENNKVYYVVKLDDLDAATVKSLQNKLPPYVISNIGASTMIFKDRFLEFIGKAELAKSKGFFDKLFSIFSRKNN